MSPLLPSLIETATRVFGAGLLLRFYYKPELTLFYKKKWVLFGTGALFLYSAIDTWTAFQKQEDTVAFSQEELVQMVLDSDVLAEDDLLFKSPHGYTILVPAGFKYSHHESGALSMSAIKEGATLTVVRYEHTGSLESLSSQIRDKSTRDEPQFEFTDQQTVAVGGIPAIRLEYLYRGDTVVQGSTLLIKKGNVCFEVSCACSADRYEESRAHFEAIFDSLTLK